MTAILLGAAALPLLAQQNGRTNAPQNSTSSSSASDNQPDARREHREPCWEEAGIAPRVIEQARIIEMNERDQIKAICSNSSLTAAQQDARLQSLEQQAQQTISVLIPAGKEEKLQACLASRGIKVEQPPTQCQASAPAPPSTPIVDVTSASSHKFN